MDSQPWFQGLLQKTTANLDFFSAPSKSKIRTTTKSSLTSHTCFHTRDYTLACLKAVAKQKGLSPRGNKAALKARLYTWMLLTERAGFLQAWFRGALCRLALQQQGLRYRLSCVNSLDCLTREEIRYIPPALFFGFCDGVCYGFHADSFRALLSFPPLRNPFTQQPISDHVVERFRKWQHLDRVSTQPRQAKEKGGTKEDDREDKEDKEDKGDKGETDCSLQVSDAKRFELQVLDLFHQFDTMGYYTSHRWFMELSPQQLAMWFQQLQLIWLERAQLTEEMQRNICPPHGTPFAAVTPEVFHNATRLQHAMFCVAHQLTTSGRTSSNRETGASFVLGALTLVNASAATSIPWLFKAMCYMM